MMKAATNLILLYDLMKILNNSFNNQSFTLILEQNSILSSAMPHALSTHRKIVTLFLYILKYNKAFRFNLF